MILRNCYNLLCDLAQIEKEITAIKQQLDQSNIEVDEEKLLQAIIKNHIKDKN